MSTQAIDRTRLQPRRGRPGFLAIGLGIGLSLGSGSGLDPRNEARAAKINSAATNAPLKYPTYLNSEGHILVPSNVTHTLSAKDRAQAAYVAYKLADGASVSTSIPLMKTASPVGDSARQAMTAVSSNLGQITVKTQKGLYLVNHYRANPALSAHKAAVKNGVAVNPKATTSHVAIKTSAQHVGVTKSTPASALNSLKNLFNLNTAKNSLESSPIGKLLKLNNTPKATTKAEELAPSSGLTLVPATTVHEAPVPEPGTLMFAGLAIASAAVRRGLQRRKTARI